MMGMQALCAELLERLADGAVLNNARGPNVEEILPARGTYALRETAGVTIDSGGRRYRSGSKLLPHLRAF